jgi:glutamate dehydrogenase/leucine dehydrogenase
MANIGQVLVSLTEELRDIIAMVYDEMRIHTQLMDNMSRCIDDLHTYHMSKQSEIDRRHRMMQGM